MIDVQDVTHLFGQRPVLSDVTVALHERRVAIIGANGSGKSTFARLLNGLVLPTHGRVLVEGADTRTHGRDVRRKVGFCFQNPDNQIVFPVVSEDLAFGLKHLGLPPDVLERRISDVLERYGLAHLRDAPTYHLSGGEKQLIALAGVLIAEPRYVVLDEPMTLLDLKNKRTVAQIIASLPQTVIMVSHDLEFISAFDRALLFDDGRIAVDDVPQVAARAYIERVS